MGAFVYCHACDHPHGPPGLADCILRSYRCEACDAPLMVDFDWTLRDHVETIVDTMQLFNEEIGRLYRLNGGIDPRDDEQWNGL